MTTYKKGRTFKTMIEEFVAQSDYLKDDLIPAYNSARGKKIFDDTLALMRQKFPHYIRELEGIAEGSQVPFHLVI